MAALGLGETLTSTPDAGLHFIAAAALGPLALAWRRKAPVVVVVLAACSLVLVTELNSHETTFTAWLTMLVAMVTLGFETPLNVSLPVVGLVAVAFLVGPILVGDDERRTTALDVGFMAAGYGGAFSAGAIIRVRSQRTRQMELHALQLERAHAREVEAAAEAERSRIARELHDVVSHSISVIAVQTQAVRRRLKPGHERESEDLRTVETVARQALTEMRRMLGVLRASGSAIDLEPQPGLAELDALIDRMKSAGLVVQLRTQGAAMPLPPGVDLTAYRVIQEALTNVLRHTNSATAEVGISYSETTLTISVQDNGSPVPTTTPSSGQGLIGMRERLNLYGGRLDVDPGENGRGFRVVATLPVHAEAVSG